MKRFATIFSMLGVLALAGYAYSANGEPKNLYQYFVGHVPSIEERKPLAELCGIQDYQGNFLENRKLLNCLLEEDKKIGQQFLGDVVFIPNEELLGAGYNPITGYQSRLTGFVDSDDATIPVASTRDKASNQILLANISTSSTVRVYLNIDPGTSSEEPIVCTGITVSSWTNCTRGLTFQGSSETTSTTVARSHNAGTPIIITNIAQFFNSFVSTDGDQVITGTTTFSNRLATTTVVLGPGNTSYAKCFEIRNGDTSRPYWCYNETAGDDALGRWVVSHNGTDSFIVPTSTNGFTYGGVGIDLTNSVMSLNVAATSTSGLGLLGDFLTIVTTSDNGITANAGGIAINTSTGHVWSVSTTFNGGVSFRNTTSTNATTTVLNSTIVSSTNYVFNGVNANNLAINSSTNAGSLHYHPTSTAMGLLVFAPGELTAVTVSHRLGVIPSMISIDAAGITSDGVNANMATSYGFTTSTIISDNQVYYTVVNEAGLPISVSATSTGKIVELEDDTGAADFNVRISAWDLNTFTVTVINNVDQAADGSRMMRWTAYK